MIQLDNLYNYMADIIKIFVDAHIDMDKLNAIPGKSMEESRQQIKALFDNKNMGVQTFLSNQKVSNHKNYAMLSVLLSILDEEAFRMERKKKIYKLDFSDIICIDSLNTEENRKKTDIMLLPRYSCIWEGKSRQEGHALDINALLRYTYSVILKNGKVCGEYTVHNYIMDERLYDVCMNKENQQVLSIAVSPVTENIDLSYDFYYEESEGLSTNYFTVKPYGEQTEKQLIELVKHIIRKADENACELLVFPEMLGTEKMVEAVQSMLNMEPLMYIKLLILPSIWTKDAAKHHNTNKSCVMDYSGKILFYQNKLKRFPYKTDSGEHYLEDIEESKEIHIIHNRGYGSAAVLICRSELEDSKRDILIKELNVKLLLCPSWSTGDYDFELSIMSGAERDCNTAWCNTCSALNDKTAKNKRIGIISAYGRNRQWSQSDLNNRAVPAESITKAEKNLMTKSEAKVPGSYICEHNCEQYCYYEKKIYGTDYREESWVNSDDRCWKEGIEKS